MISRKKYKEAKVDRSYILVNDVGTTGVRSIIIDKENNIVSEAYEEVPQLFPKPSWVEQDPEVIWEKCLEVTKKTLKDANLTAKEIAAMGIATQRATNVLWDKRTEKPVYNAITWQDTRTAKLCEEISHKTSFKFIRGIGRMITGIAKVIKPLKKSKTGRMLITASHLSLTPEMSSAHVRWVLDNVEGAKEKAKNGDLLFGTLDTWLVWKYTEGRVHATDFSEVSCTGMFDPFSLKWSKMLLKPFNIPKKLKLPEIKETSDDFGKTKLFGEPVPITCVVADQQSALFGEACFKPGDVKCTNGTGTFIDMNTGKDPMASVHQLTPMIAWKLKGKVTYLLEGFVNTTGSAIQWLRDGLQIISSAEETEKLAMSVEDTSGVYLVPAFTGLSSPYWDPYARGTILGLTRGVKKEHLIRATLEAIAYRGKDIMLAMEEDTGIHVRLIKADGGASKNDFILQFLSDLLNVDVERPKILEATALGVAYFAGLHVGYWKSQEDLIKYRKVDKRYTPKMVESKRKELYAEWKRAVGRALDWSH